MLKNLLLYRMILFNLLGLAVLIVSFSQGWIQYVFKSDHSHITYVIAGLFIVGIVGTFHRASKVSKALNILKTGIPSPALREDVQKMPIKNGYLHTIMESLTAIGIAGTVIGMLIMMKDLDLANPDLGQLVKNLGIAFMCTLVGVSTTVWTSFNVRMLDTATNLLIKDSTP